MSNKKKSKNIFMKNKKGQFYLIAAIIIIGIIIGFAAVKNYTSRKEVIKLYNLGEELKIESENVLDYGTYNEFDDEQIDALLTKFVETYEKEATEGKNLYFIFGNEKKINVIAYQSLYEKIQLGIEGEALELIEPGETYEFYPGDGGSIHKFVVVIEEHEYPFELKYGKNFYFILTQEIEEGQYVVTSE